MPPSPKQYFASRYDDGVRSAERIQQGKHRALVGGLWEEMGQLQLDFLRSNGLQPEHRVLDLGCGCLRAGVKLIAFLEPNHYFGIDLEKSLLQVGYRKELVKAGLQDRLDRGNLYCSRLFVHERLPDSSIEFGLCCSVMTHLPPNFLRICLENARVYFKPGARLFISFFELPPGARFAEKLAQQEGLVTSGFADPYHCSRLDMLAVAEITGWTARYIGAWNHPHNQVMVEYTRT